MKCFVKLTEADGLPLYVMASKIDAIVTYSDGTRVVVNGKVYIVKETPEQVDALCVEQFKIIQEELKRK
jgi:uncharacterized protein YlzI (FlbEa/FlbD family)